MVRARGMATAGLVALALAAGGCGGDDGAQADAYVDAVNAAQQAFATRIERIEATTDDEAALAAYVRASEQAAADLRAIDPPEDVADLHGRLVGGFDAFAQETAAAEDAITSGELERVLVAQQRMLRATRSQQQLIRSTMAEINQELQAG